MGSGVATLKAGSHNSIGLPLKKGQGTNYNNRVKVGQMNPKTTEYLNSYGAYGLGVAKDNAGKGESKYLDRHNKKKIQERLSVQTGTPSKRTPVKRDLSISAKSGKTPKDYFRNKNVEEITNYEQEVIFFYF
jgi:hypothetical protein